MQIDKVKYKGIYFSGITVNNFSLLTLSLISDAYTIGHGLKAGRIIHV